jgi:hypothetical protein
VRPSWFDFLCGEAGRLIDQCGDKRARISANVFVNQSIALSIGMFIN